MHPPHPLFQLYMYVIIKTPSMAVYRPNSLLPLCPQTPCYTDTCTTGVSLLPGYTPVGILQNSIYMIYFLQTRAIFH